MPPRATTKVDPIAAYIAAQPAKVQAILQRIRAAIRKAAPDAEERLSYRMPAFFQNGVLAYIGAFQKHIGFFPPVRDEKLKAAAAKYAGPKGNLQFPLDQPIPYGLIGRIVKSRVKENAAKTKPAKGGRRK